MREILFRGKRVDNGEWVEGYYFHTQQFKNGRSCQDVYLIRDDCDEDFEVIPETVGQYTGLQDKNGKKIFEGDIVKDEYGTGVVRWLQESCAYVVFETNPSKYYFMESDGQLKTTEVIGNIHDKH